MAKKINIKIDFSKVKGAFKCNIKGQKETKECLCLPMDMFFQGKNGALYFDITGYESNGKYGDIYSLKQKFSKAEYDKMSEAERKSTPFIGTIKEDTYGQQQQAAPSYPMSNGSNPLPDDMPAEYDTPF